MEHKEQWKQIEGYNGRYIVSDRGRVKSLRKSTGEYKLLKGSKTPSGYLRVTLCLNGKPTNYGVSRLVAYAFIPNPDNKPEVNHINGIKTDNMVENLEWATRSENVKHSFVSGLKESNLKNWSNDVSNNGTKVSVFTKEGEFIKSYDTIIDASKDLNVHRVSISRVCRGKRKTANGYKFKYI